MKRRLGITLLGLAGLIGGLAPSAEASTAAATPPWGPTTVLYQGKISQAISQATSSHGMTVIVFRAEPRGKPSLVEAAVQLPGQPWTAPVALSTGAVARPTVISWGAGMVSVIWQSPAGTNNYLFHIRTINPDGSWQDSKPLTKAVYAYSWYQAAINSQGQVALSWSNGDNRDRVVVQRTNGTWMRPPAVPVVHPTYQGTPFTANPLKLFLDDGGHVTDVTWGTLDGSIRAIWMMRLTAQNSWSRERVGPLGNSMLGYDWVHEASFSADPQGDIAAVYPQVDRDTKQWSIMFRYRPTDGALGAPRLLSHLRCYDFTDPCGDVAVTADGTALIGWAVHASGSDIFVRFMRRSPDGTFSQEQSIAGPLWLNTYSSIDVAANARGDAVVSFQGGDHQRSYGQFVRCPALSSCDTAQRRNNQPSWLEPWVTSVGPAGGSTVTWPVFNHGGLDTRHLAAFTG